MSEDREYRAKETDEPETEDTEVDAHVKQTRQADETATETDDVEAHVKSTGGGKQH
jgi:hypothetical protein